MIAAILLLAATVTVPAPPVVRTIAVPNNQIPTEITAHAGALWFVSWHNWPKVEPYLGRINTVGTIHLAELLNGSKPGLTAHDKDGTLWLSDAGRDRLWHVARNGKVTFVRIDRETESIAFGSDGKLWCTHPGSPTISSYNADGTLRARWDVPARKGGAAPQPAWLTPGADGALWFTDRVTDTVGRITTTGEIKIFPLPKKWLDPGEIVATADTLWFTVGNQALLGRITTKGVVTSAKIHAPARAVEPGAENRIWYSDGGAAIGWLQPNGATDYVLVSDKPASVRALAAGPDGAMWFVDQKTRTIGRVELPKK